MDLSGLILARVVVRLLRVRDEEYPLPHGLNPAFQSREQWGDHLEHLHPALSVPEHVYAGIQQAVDAVDYVGGQS
jgi:hypothetical protein